MADVRELTARNVVSALDAFGIEDSWIIARSVRAATPDSTFLKDVERLKKMSAAFRNLVVGTIAEGVFEATQLRPLEPFGFGIVDYHEKGENRDYGVQKAGIELPINVKTASTIFRNAKTTVGLDPEDCIPISAYKAIGASDRVPNLLYVDLVDFDLREKVDAFVDGLTGDAAVLWDLLSWYGESGAKKAQDQFISVLFNMHRPALEAFVADASKFRAISAKRVVAIMRDKPRRVPGLGIKAAGTGAFVAEVNVHVSVKDETMPWNDVADLIRAEGIDEALKLIQHTEDRTVPAPRL